MLKKDKYYGGPEPYTPEYCSENIKIPKPILPHKCDICMSEDIIQKYDAIFCNKCGSLLGWIKD